MDEHATGATGELRFPAGFRWGVATAAHQYEGGNDGNNWSAWERSGHIRGGDRSGLACDWWNHAERDFDLAQRMGLNALRLSVEWSRIEPRPGEWDVAAIARYRQMLQGLRERGIEPMVTLHHFTNPLWFEERGAFLAPYAADLFARFAARVVAELGDLCDLWCTVNEPSVYAIMGYLAGIFPPGRQGDQRRAVAVQASMARAHAAAYAAIHRAQPDARVGWAQNYNIFAPANPRSPLDRLVAGIQDAAFNDFFPRTIRSGSAAWPFRLASGSLAGVRGTCDYVGVNLYYRDLVSFDPRHAIEAFGRRETQPGAPQGTDTTGAPAYSEVYPKAIALVARRVARMGKPVYVTENGVTDPDDRLRPWQLASAVKTLHGLIQEGVDLRGYYHWSLVDNFEWSEGWRMRFGLVALDERTQERTPRPSAALYGAIAHANALTPAMVREYAPNALGELFPTE